MAQAGDRQVFERLAREGAVIDRLVSDSRRAGPGAAFFAWRGERADGRSHVADAVARGAAAVLWDPEGFGWNGEWRVPNAPVPALRSRAGLLADAFHAHPSKDLWVCGVTGTNGKTSCSQWIAAALDAQGTRAGVVGTLGAGLAGTTLEPTVNTTPDALEVHRLLAGFRAAGARAAAMEVSSHALAQERVNGVRFRCALFTNLSHDHLDYHGTMQAYAEAKARLFAMPGLETAVLNLDDVAGVRLAQRLRGTGVRTIGYSLTAGAVAPGSVDEAVAATRIEFGADATEIVVACAGQSVPLRLTQPGRFSAANALGVFGCLVAHGLDPAEAAARVAALPAVPGRLQRLGGNGRPLVVVDYAHTPDAIENVLRTLRPVADARGGRLVAVFGAGGDRDPSKRAAMGEAASRRADRVVLTSDNPRGEDPDAILVAIAAGVGTAHSVVRDRAEAISLAVAKASPADVILVAGKGHEAYQEVAGRRLPFSDVAVAQAALDQRRPA